LPSGRRKHHPWAELGPGSAADETGSDFAKTAERPLVPVAPK